MKIRVVFLHGRPPHPFHRALAESVGAEFLPFDFLLRYQDRPRSRARECLSWLCTSAFFPAIERYDLLLTEGLQLPPALMRAMGVLRPGQRAVGLLANETVYFLRERRYRRVTAAALRAALRGYDGFICHGEMIAGLAREALSEAGAAATPVRHVPSGIPEARRRHFAAAASDLEARRVVFIGGGPAPWRAWYKGLDLAYQAVAAAAPGLPGLSLTVVGDWPRGFEREVVGMGPQRWATCVGALPDVLPALSGASLCVALGRGDAGPLSVLEAMSAGVPVLTSQWTGLKEAARRVDPRLVVPLSADAAAAAIGWYMGLARGEREALSLRAREVAAGYQESASVAAFGRALRELAGARPVAAPHAADLLV